MSWSPRSRRNGEPDEYLIPKGKHVSVHEGDRVRPGEALMDGSSNPHDILKIKGEKELAKYLVDEVQEVYRLQGVKINDKHIESDRAADAAQGEDHGCRATPTSCSVSRWRRATFERGERASSMIEEGRAARRSAEPQLLGITKASLSTESFISAASFQETTKVLTEAAIWGKTDRLRGLKENVIMGRLIPAGTGLEQYKGIGIQVEAPETSPIRHEEGELEPLDHRWSSPACRREQFSAEPTWPAERKPDRESGTNAGQAGIGQAIEQVEKS